MELLAPAGSPEALTAAVQAGADAVYLGFGPLNARRNAKNVTREELETTVQAAVKKALTDDLVASDDEVDEVMAEIFGGTGEDGAVATDEEVAEVFREIFGK